MAESTNVLWVKDNQPVFENFKFYLRNESNGIRNFRCTNFQSGCRVTINMEENRNGSIDASYGQTAAHLKDCDQWSN